MSSLSTNRNLFWIVLILTVLFNGWYFLRIPSNDREWSLDQQVLPSAEFVGDAVTVFNIRNFTYQAEDVYTPAYYDKTFNLNDLTSLDYIVEPFDSIGAAHTFLSFGFTTGDYLAVSVEIRKEVGEEFSPLRGLLRSYELMYVIADERDVIPLRTNHRQDTVYLYPVVIPPDTIKQLFVSMLTRANALKEKPEFYNTLTNTCTTNIVRHVNELIPGKIPWDVRLLLPENSDVLAYELGLLDTSVPLAQLRERHQINAKAEKYSESPQFSTLIRQE